MVNVNRTPLLSLSKERGDFIVETFRAGGKGGQNQNKVSSGVRIRHPASGAVAECREERQQLQNKKRAFAKLVETSEFKAWHKAAIARALGHVVETEREIDKSVDEQMVPENLLIEYYDPEEGE